VEFGTGRCVLEQQERSNINKPQERSNINNDQEAARKEQHK